MAHIEINGTHLASALLVAPKGDIRYYLNGVYVEWSATVTRTVATNGHILWIADHDRMTKGDGPFEINDYASGSMIVPRAALETLKPKANERYAIVIDGGIHTIRNVKETGGILFSPVEGKFPDYVRVLPTFDPAPDWVSAWSGETRDDAGHVKLPNAVLNLNNKERIEVPEHMVTYVLERLNMRHRVAQFNAEYQAIAGKIYRLRYGKGGGCAPTLYHNGMGTSVYKFDDKSYMLIMSVRVEGADTFPILDQFRTSVIVTPEKEEQAQPEQVAEEEQSAQVEHQGD